MSSGSDSSKPSSAKLKEPRVTGIGTDERSSRQSAVEVKVELDRLSHEMQRWTTDLLMRHRRMVAENKAMPKASRQQRVIALRDRSSEDLRSLAKLPAAETVERYMTRAASALRESWEKRSSVWTLVEERSGNIDSWYTFKAGVQYYLEAQLGGVKRALDQWQRVRRCEGASLESDYLGTSLLQQLRRLGESLEQTPTQAPARFKGDGRSRRYQKRSKSASLRAVAQDWRERCALTMDSSLKLPFLIQCVTGCRPQELANGVQVRLLRDGTLVTRVRGAKTDDVAGQPVRSMRLGTRCGGAQLLASLLKVGDTLDSRKLGIGEVNTYGRKVARACARAFPERKGRMRLSAYSVRHQFKADLAAAGFSPAEIAMAMGHSTTRSGTAYGRGGRAGGAGVSPLAIKARRAVRSRSPYPVQHNVAAASEVGLGNVRRRKRAKP